MGEDDAVIHTGVERLLKYVEDDGEVSLGTAANELGADKDLVMDWALALQESGLLNIKYSAFHGRVLSPVEQDVDEEDVEEASKKVVNENERLDRIRKAESELEELMEAIEDVEQELDEEMADVESLEEVLGVEGREEVREYLEELGSAEEEMEEVQEDLEDVISGVQDLELPSEGMIEQESGSWLDSLLPWRTGETFKCLECGKEFDTARGARTHRGMVHD